MKALDVCVNIFHTTSCQAAIPSRNFLTRKPHQIERRHIRDTAIRETAPAKVYTIGDLARELDISTRTIRYYEERGLLNPMRSDNTQQRLYTPRDRVRLTLLLRARGLGFALEDIRELFEIYDATHDARRQGARLRQMIVERLDQVERQLRDLTDLRDELRDALEQVDDTILSRGRA